MNIIGIYDQLSSTWQKARGHILSHLVCGLLLWFVGFSPSIPQYSLQDVASLRASPLYEFLQGAGFLALSTILLACVIGIYAVLLQELGRPLLIGVLSFFHSRISLSEAITHLPDRLLFNIAATMEPGPRLPHELQTRAAELVQTYAISETEKLKSLLRSSEQVGQHAVTCAQDSLLFLTIWTVIFLLPVDFSKWTDGTSSVYMKGLIVLGINFLLARNRLYSSIQLTYIEIMKAVARMVEIDPQFVDRMKIAKGNSSPYDELIRLYRSSQSGPKGPSLKRYIERGLRFTRFKVRKVRFASRKARTGTRMATLVARLRGWGYRKEEYQAYQDKYWVLKYIGWQLQRLSRRSYFIAGKMIERVMVVVGLRRLF